MTEPQQLNLEQVAAILIDAGVVSVSADGRLLINGRAYQPEGDNHAETQADVFDDAGFSAPNDFGARQLRGIEEYRKQLSDEGFDQLAEELPQWFMTPPAAMANAADVEAWREAHPAWSEQQLMNALENCRRATLPGYSKMIRQAFRYEAETNRRGNTYYSSTHEALPNTRACGIGWALEADSEAELHDLIVARMRETFENKKSPSVWWP